MERRLLLAVVLSLFVLYVWAGLTRPQKSQEIEPDVSQSIGIKEVTEIEPTTPPSSLPSLEAEEPIETAVLEEPSVKEDLITLENEKLRIGFSLRGGTIKEAYIKDYDASLPVANLGIISGYDKAAFKLDNKTNSSITFSHESGAFKIITTYQLLDDDYILKQSTNIQNITEMSKKVNLKLNGLTIDGSRMDINGGNARDKGLNEYVINSYSGITRKANAFKFSEKEEEQKEGHVVWAGFRDRYYCAIVKPDFESIGYEISPKGEKRMDLNILLNETVLAGGGGVNLSSIIFIGPESQDILKSYELGLEKIKKFYRFGLFDIIAMIIYNFMNFVHKFIPNWGLCIIIVSVILYFSMYPLTLRGMSSMKRMQAMQPEMTKLKEKYKENPQKMNQEMMKIYKENKINPIGGCLPFLLQMPIFIGLYQVLWRSVDFKGANFMWIKDLSEPDRFYILPSKLPLMGDEINLLPILMMVIMFFQQRITTKNMQVTDPMQRQQQKMMGILMPVFLGVIFYKFASGLTLYFTMFYIFSTFTQYHMYSKKTA